MKQIQMKRCFSLEEHFEQFLLAKSAKGAVDKTLLTYKNHFKAISRFLDLSKGFESLTQNDLNVMIDSMRNSNLSDSSIKSYSITMRAFINWARENNLTQLSVKAYKCNEVIKETYSKEELFLLLKKPSLQTCSFSEYRNWVIVNLLVNCGCRAGTIRFIKIGDINLESHLIIARHTKNKKPLTMPLCSEMISILREYLKYRDGSEADYLFCNIYGEPMSENCLRLAIQRYNKSRGVDKTSIHAFRHTFAKLFLTECDGDAFVLQKLLGHSTLDMTKHYCALFDSEIAHNYDSVSPLSRLKKTSKRLIMDK